MQDVDVLREKVEQWKEAHRDAPRDLDFDMLCAVLDVVNEESAVKVARNPLDADRNWVADTEAHNVGKLDVDDQGRLVLGIRHDHEELKAEKMAEQLDKLKRRVAGPSSKVLVRLSDAKSVELTDVYSHALVKDTWAGLPFDVVLAYYEEA